MNFERWCGRLGREIKFRGKRIDNGEWVYGGYYKHINGQVGILSGDMTGEHEAIVDEVDPETVGQFTGLRDKNGVEIYEGDVVKVPQGYYGDIFHSETMGQVKYHAPEFWVEVNMGGHSDFSWNNLEVIDNIYENPELLEVSNNG